MSGDPDRKWEWGMGRLFLSGMQLIAGAWYLMQVAGADVLQEVAAVDWTVLLAALSCGIAGILLRSFRRQIILRPIQKYTILDLTAESLRGIRQRMSFRGRSSDRNGPSGLLRKSGVPVHVSRIFLAADRWADILAGAVFLLLCLFLWNVPAGLFALTAGCLTSAVVVLLLYPGFHSRRRTRRNDIAGEINRKISLFRSKLRTVTKSIGRGNKDTLLVWYLTLLAMGVDFLALVLTAGAMHLSLGFLLAVLLLCFLVALWQSPILPGGPFLIDTLLLLFLRFSGWAYVETAVPVLLGHVAFILAVEWAAAAATAAEGMQQFQKPVLLRIRMAAWMIPTSTVPEMVEAVNRNGISSAQSGKQALWENRDRDGFRKLINRLGKRNPAPG